MTRSICDRLKICQTAFAHGRPLYPNLRKALIGVDVRVPRRVQGLVLLRFFAYGSAKTAFFDNSFLKNAPPRSIF